MRWSNRLKGDERLRFITNALTRMRFCSSKGDLDFTSKEGIDAAPTNYYPWFTAPKRKTAHVPIFFGHWSTLGLVQKNNAFGLDTGCVWGRKLSAMSLDLDHQLVQINATSKN